MLAKYKIARKTRVLSKETLPKIKPFFDTEVQMQVKRTSFGENLGNYPTSFSGLCP